LKNKVKFFIFVIGFIVGERSQGCY